VRAEALCSKGDQRIRETSMSDRDNTRARPPRQFVKQYLGAFGHRGPRQNQPGDAEPATASTRPVGALVVGVDDSPASYTAVDQAAVEAELRHEDLRLLHVQPAGAARYPAGDHGARLLEKMAERVHASAPGVAVSGHLAIGAAATELLEELSETDMVVVGHRGSPPRTEFGLSIAERVVARHRGPALVTRPAGPESRTGRPIVVGVDDPATRTPALDFARAEAKLRSCELLVLHAKGDRSVPEDCQVVQDGVRVHHRAVTGDQTEALVAASEQAAAVIVDRHGGAGDTMVNVGSIGRSLVREAACPVFLIG
jgi:nucleotide-binding universal stress UspA family protein